MKEYRFYVSGMHCSSCTVLIADTLKEQEAVCEATVDLHSQEVVVTCDIKEAEPTLESLVEKFSPLVADQGYAFTMIKPVKKVNWKDFWYAIPIALVFMVAFWLLQKAGLINLITTSEVSLSTALLIGVIASLSSCLAIVGGLVLSASASYAKAGGTWRPAMSFHLGRLGGFFLLGGLIGMLGSAFHLNGTVSLVMGVLVAVVMLILGINLLDIFHSTKRLQLTMPKVFTKHITRIKESQHWVAPLLLGVATFFLPCGFTQSMQLYSLSTGSFWSGAMTMGVFALGTLPVLALLSFGAMSVEQSKWKGVFYKTAGLIVIALAVINVISVLVVAGLINPLFSF